MNRTDWTVGKEGLRESSPDRCFYCHQAIGAQHGKDCVIRSRTVVVDFTMRLVLPEPESHEPGTIMFHYNEGSWCGSNLIRLLQEAERRLSCLCADVSAKYIREASEQDEEDHKMFVAELPS